LHLYLHHPYCFFDLALVFVDPTIRDKFSILENGLVYAGMRSKHDKCTSILFIIAKDKIKRIVCWSLILDELHIFDIYINYQYNQIILE
jgi:hypothetical protein